MNKAASDRIRSALTPALLLAGWALVSVALYHAEFRREGHFFYQSLTLWTWLAGTVLAVPVFWWLGRRLDRGRWGVPFWRLESAADSPNWMPAAVFWLDFVALALAVGHRVAAGHWSWPLTAMAGVVVIGGIVFLLLKDPEYTAGESETDISVAWIRLGVFAVMCGVVAVLLYRFFYAGPTRWYPVLFVSILMALAFLLSFRWRGLQVAGFVATALLAVLSGWLYTYQKAYFPALYVWLAGLAVLLVTFHRRSERPPMPRWSFARWEFIFLALLTVAAALLRMWNLRDLPPDFINDEALEGIAAQNIVNGRLADPFALVAYHHNNLFYYLMALGVRLIHDPIVSIRLVTALAGTLAVPLLYLLVREPFGRLAAVFSSLLLCVGYSAIHYSRMGLGLAYVLPFTIAVLFLLWRAFAPGRDARYFLWLGFITALSLYGYPAMRGNLLIAALFICYLLFTRPRQVLMPLRGWAVALFAALVVLTPLLSHNFGNQFGSWRHRMQDVMIWQQLYLDRTKPQQYQSNPQRYFWTIDGMPKVSQIGCSQFFDMFTSPFYGRDTAGSFNLDGGFIDFGTGVLFLMGLAFSFASWHRPKYAFLNIWYWTTMLTGGVLTQDPPYFARLVPLLPVAAIWPGLMLARTLQGLSGRPGQDRLPGWSLALGGLVVAAIASTSFYDYFVDYCRRDNLYNREPTLARLVKEYILKQDRTKVRFALLTGGDLPWDRPIISYLAPGYEGEDYASVDSYLPLRRPVDKDIAFVALMRFIPILKVQPPAFYPGGTFTPIGPPGTPIWMAYYVTKDQVNSQYDRLVRQGKLPAVPEPDLPGRQRVEPQALPRKPAEMNPAVPRIEAACTPWRVVAVEPHDTRVGVLPNDFGRLKSIVLHPISRTEPAAIEWRGQLEAGKNWQLSFDAASHAEVPEADAQMRVYANGQLLDERFLGPRLDRADTWRSFKYDLTRFAGQPLVVQIWNVANGWSFEYLHLANLRIEAAAPVAPEPPPVGPQPVQKGPVEAVPAAPSPPSRPPNRPRAAAQSEPPRTAPGGNGLVVLVTDRTWKCSTEEKPDWFAPEFDDSNWRPVEAPYHMVWEAMLKPDALAPGSRAMPVWAPGEPETVLLRRSFVLDGVPVRPCEIRIAVDDNYDLYVNGLQVVSSRGAQILPAQVYDVTELLHSGPNVVAIKGINATGKRAVLVQAEIRTLTPEAVRQRVRAELRLAALLAGTAAVLGVATWAMSRRSGRQV